MACDVPAQLERKSETLVLLFQIRSGLIQKISISPTFTCNPYTSYPQAVILRVFRRHYTSTYTPCMQFECGKEEVGGAIILITVSFASSIAKDASRTWSKVNWSRLQPPHTTHDWSRNTATMKPLDGDFILNHPIHTQCWRKPVKPVKTHDYRQIVG